MPLVRFSDGTAPVEVPVGTPLGDAIAQANYQGVVWGCTQGVCGTCRFRPGAGGEALAPASRVERQILNEVGAFEGERLACHVRVVADLEIKPSGPSD